MKFNFTFSLLLLLPFLTFSQVGKFEIKNYVIIEPIVQRIDGIETKELYLKANDWLKLVYQNPSKTIQSKSENDFIRFSGVGYKVFQGTFAYMDLNYTLRIDFKDDRYRLTLESYSFWNSGTGNEYPLDVYVIDGKLSKRNGKIHSKLCTGMLNELNSINQSLYDYITGKTEAIKDDW